MDGAALSPSDWTNLYESVFREERGEQDYTEKLEQQITQFQVSSALVSSDSPRYSQTPRWGPVPRVL